ncbi:MAG: YitT family protein [Anaerorhabdus sp.]
MKKIQNYGMIFFGSALFAVAVNIFVAPHALFNGGFVGISQLLSSFLQSVGMTQVNLTAVFHFLLNIPLFIISYKSMSKKFFMGSLFSVIIITVLFAVVPISSTPIMGDRLASCIIGGILAGAGVGLVLTNGAASGGLDIIGVYITLNFKSFKVGQMQLAVNVIIYSICALLFDVEIALYSIIYQLVASFVMDKVYFQNIEVSAMIFTKNQEIKRLIIEEVERGVTYWKGLGGYTHQETEVLVTVVSKYEIHRLKRILKENDPNAFMILSDNLQVYGSYKKRLI